MFIIFFFQAEDGIRDGTVTGVQTCALPILLANATTNTLAGLRKTALILCLSDRHKAERQQDRESCGYATHTTPPITNRDRKSTCLNSSHSSISYAVSCLKKKKKIKKTRNSK